MGAAGGGATVEAAEEEVAVGDVALAVAPPLHAVLERGGRLAAEEEATEGGVVGVGAGGGGGRGLEDAAEEVRVRGPGGGGARGLWGGSGGGGGGVVGHFFRPRAACARAGERSEGGLLVSRNG